MELRGTEKSSSLERGEAEMLTTSEVTGTKGEGSGASFILLSDKKNSRTIFALLQAR